MKAPVCGSNFSPQDDWTPQAKNRNEVALEHKTKRETQKIYVKIFN